MVISVPYGIKYSWLRIFLQKNKHEVKKKLKAGIYYALAKCL